MGFYFVRFAEPDVDSSAIGFPPGNAGAEFLICVLDALVILLFVFVLRSVRIGPEPEVFDELIALFIGLQRLEGFAFFISDNVRHIFVEPLLINALELFFLLPCVWVFFFALFLILAVFLSSKATWDDAARHDGNQDDSSGFSEETCFPLHRTNSFPDSTQGPWVIKRALMVFELPVYVPSRGPVKDPDKPRPLALECR